MLYPVADTPEQAMHAPKGFAEREREARHLGAGAVAFVTESTGPAFESEAAARDAFPTLAAQPWATLRPVSDKPVATVSPVNRDGRRWPEPKRQGRGLGKTLWRFSLSYWRIVGAEQGPKAAARQLRRSDEGEALDAKTLRALSRQPLRPVKPQQALDIGLFEVRPPDAPHIVMPDE